MKSVFVFDGRSRAALQIVRSFGEKGFRVFVGNESWICSSFFSRYVFKRIKYPNPKTKEFKNFIFSLLKKYKIDVIIPVRDDTTIFCAKYYVDLKKYTNLLISDYSTILIGRDKSLTYEYAKKFKVPVPYTLIINNTQELLSYNKQYPIVLKPAISSGSRGLYVVNNKKELEKIANYIFKKYDKYLLQDFIPAERTLGVNVVFDEESKLVAAFSYKRIREFPRNGGPSVLRESTYDKSLIDIAVNFMKNLHWKGVAMLEFKLDSRDNIPKLMEINPRFWGSLALPIFAGIDIPYLLYCLAIQEEVQLISHYRAGVRARWLFMGDFLWLLTSKNKIKDFKEFCAINKEDTVYDIYSRKDFFPVIGAILEGFCFILNKKKRAHALGRGKKIR